MQPAESFRVLLFVSAVGTVYVLAAGIVVRWACRRFGGSAAPPPSRRRLLVHRIILSLAGLGVLCIAYGRFIEPYWLEVTHARLATPKLSHGSRPVRIAHISDLHCDAAPRLEEGLPDVIAGQKPDLIVFTGDSINSPDGLPVFRRCLTRLAAVAPTFVVKGNWDAWFWGRLDLFGGTGARELDGEAAKVEVAGTEVWVAGVGVGREGRAPKALAGVPPGAFCVFLYHYPDPDALPAGGGGRAVDLFCAGHVHGGQVALPFYGALVTLSKYGKQYEAGLYRVGPTWMYVSRGIGMEGGPAPRVRFCARPEVTVIEVGAEP